MSISTWWAAIATSCGVIRPGVSLSSAPSNATDTAADVPVEAPAGASEKIVTCRERSPGSSYSEWPLPAAGVWSRHHASGAIAYRSP